MTDCVICLEPFSIGQKIVQVPICKHYFHPDCCLKWFQSATQEDGRKCPLCNAEISVDLIKAYRNSLEASDKVVINIEDKRGD